MPVAERTNNPFSGALLDRRGADRAIAAWPERVLADPAARFVLSRGTRHLIRRLPSPAIAFLDAADPLVRNASAADFTLLGHHLGAPCVLLDSPAELPELPPGTSWEELRPLLGLLSAEEAVILTCARALGVWRSRQLHCGVCGSPTEPRQAGHAVRCTSSACGADFFPRIDPAVIVIVHDQGHALLGRQASWPKGRYSALAGFVEPGESLEDAVVREVAEETGIAVTQAHYFASQPWPFPASMMVGFHAEARRAAVRLDDQELEDARWFSAEEIAASPAMLLPAPYTIARRLIDAWYLQVTGRALTVLA
jgi:NAD+ diphosphatase